MISGSARFLKILEVEIYESPVLVAFESRVKSSIKLNHIKRDIIEYGQNVYENFDNCEFIYDDCKTIYELNQGRHKIDYMKYLRLKMGI